MKLKMMVRACVVAGALLCAVPAMAQQGESKPAVVKASADPVKALQAQKAGLARQQEALFKGKVTRAKLVALRDAARQIEADAGALSALSASTEQTMRSLVELRDASGDLGRMLDGYIGETEKNLGASKLRGELEVGLARVRDGLATVLGKLEG
jgi:hypothetical protein